MKRTAVHLRRLWSFASWVGTAVLFIVLGGLLVARVTHVVPLVEQTESMSPRLMPGDLLLVKHVPAAAVAPGDIVTFAHPSHPGRTLTHRVRKIESKAGLLQFETRGDASHASEHWAIQPSGQIGTLAFHVPDAGRVTRPINDPKLRSLLILLISVASSIGIVMRIWRRVPKTEPKLPRLSGFVPAREYR
ncbi:signal peptidase I [Solirubrobacter phytolaccae]|uniref:Signal peptidase I n=1 Tax=Solirubrobacter phytolaccae TaxID=1404360 RepID=A0A9X3N8Y3_9ACTN|nr:signal peptidase I [Solirubrobacter phytolaccae]MDA0180442.1 signal peptidase I [Solirubrobacter phytolaccae]